jgi:hypothetical protein
MPGGAPGAPARAAEHGVSECVHAMCASIKSKSPRFAHPSTPGASCQARGPPSRAGRAATARRAFARRSERATTSRGKQWREGARGVWRAQGGACIVHDNKRAAPPACVCLREQRRLFIRGSVVVRRYGGRAHARALRAPASPFLFARYAIARYSFRLNPSAGRAPPARRAAACAGAGAGAASASRSPCYRTKSPYSLLTLRRWWAAPARRAPLF